MTENQVIVTKTVNEVVVSSQPNKVVIASPGPQGPRGRTILNGSGAPANNFGLTGDFYYDTTTSDFYGPKLSDSTWAGVVIVQLNVASEVAYSTSWELAQVQGTGSDRYVDLTHNLGFYPNVTVKTSAGDILETGIEYISTNTIRLTMAQPFAGTAYLS